jgi:hypothetical protein
MPFEDFKKLAQGVLQHARKELADELGISVDELVRLNLRMGYATYTQTQQEPLILTVTQDGPLPFANMLNARYLSPKRYNQGGFPSFNYSF